MKAINYAIGGDKACECVMRTTPLDAQLRSLRFIHLLFFPSHCGHDLQCSPRNFVAVPVASPVGSWVVTRLRTEWGMEDLMLPPRFSRRLVISSYGSLIGVAVSAHLGHYDLTAAAFMGNAHI